MLVDDQTYLESLINQQLIPAIVNPNYILPDEYHLPEFHFQTIEEGFSNEMTDIVVKLIEKGIVKPDESWIRETIGVPENSDNAAENDTAKVDIWVKK